MTDKDHDPSALEAMARAAGEATAAAMAGQAAGLNLLWAEMQALARMMPGAAAEPPAEPEDEAARRQAEAETEANFDNMPV